MSTNSLSGQRESISIVSYNCIATEYYNHFDGLTPSQAAYADFKARYPDHVNALTAESLKFNPKKLQHVIDRIRMLNADVICVQEIASKDRSSFIEKMRTLGYLGIYAEFDNLPASQCRRRSRRKPR